MTWARKEAEILYEENQGIANIPLGDGTPVLCLVVEQGGIRKSIIGIKRGF